MTQYASVTVKRCPMSDPQCATTVIAQIASLYPQAVDAGGNPTPFDAATLVEERCGRYVRGAHKGQLRGWAELEVVAEGGWKKGGPGQGNGRVLFPGALLSVRIADFAGKAYLSVSR